jgi:hypothetical protein
LRGSPPVEKAQTQKPEAPAPQKPEAKPAPKAPPAKSDINLDDIFDLKF